MNDLSSQGLDWELEQQRLWRNHYPGDGPDPDDNVIQIPWIVKFLIILILSLGLNMGLWFLFVIISQHGIS